MATVNEEPSSRKQHARWQTTGDGMRPIDRVLACLGAYTQHGKEYSARCPAHEDKNPSLSITEADDGKVLLCCHAGCPFAAVVKALGLEDVDLFPGKRTTDKRIVATYDYVDEDGTLLYQSVRYEPKNFKLRRPNGTGWTWSLKDTRRVIYNLPAVLKAEVVFIPEGEKDVETLRAWGLTATCNPGGAKKWRDEYSKYLAGKYLLILPDNDATGEQHALQVARSVFPVAASVQVVRLPDLPDKGDVTDWRHQGHSKEELLALVEAAPLWTATDGEEADSAAEEDASNAAAGADGRPKVRITTDLAEMVDEAELHLMALPGPVLYQRARLLCRIAPAGESSKWLQRPPDAPIIVRAETVSLREESGRAVQWMRLDKRENAWVPALPPTVVFETLAARLAWKFPYLEGILHAPTLRPDGKLLTTLGYDNETGLFLHFNGVQFPPVPETPTDAEIYAARDLLRTPFSDFPFTELHHEAAAIAATLTLIARFAIPGCIPAFAIRSHAKGSGKGLLVNTIATIGTGRTAPTWTQTLDPAEEGKRLLSIALAGDACMHIDNVVYPFGSDKLDSAITSATIKDRLLGTNSNQEAPWLTVIFASGNNMGFRGDTVRRVVPVDLDPKVERPEERGGFQHSPLLEWVHAQRPQLVAAGLTLLKAFCHAGRPKQDNLPEFGSFEQWANLIRHGVVWCGFPDPCEGRKTLEAESDLGYETLATLLHCWGECYLDTQANTLKTVLQDIEQRKTPTPDAVTPANEWNVLHEALSAYDSKYDGKRLDTNRIGNALKSIEGRIVGNHRLIRKGQYNRAALWKRETTG